MAHRQSGGINFNPEPFEQLTCVACGAQVSNDFDVLEAHSCVERVDRLDIEPLPDRVVPRG